MKLPDAAEGSIKNNYLYNDKELFDDGGLNWYDYGYRNFDPQIGRFMQPDPLTDDYPELTPYHYGGDDPIANVDIDGLLSGAAIADAAKPFNQIQTLAGVVVYMKPAVTAGSVTRSFFSGLLSSALGTVKGIVHVIAHPLNTAAALGNVALHPIQTVKALKNIAINTYRVFKAGDANTKAKMIGHAAGDIAQLFIGTGEAKVGTEIAEDVGTLSKVVKETEEAEGGLNLFKYGSEQALKENGWKTGDRFLNLPNKYNPKLNWEQNSGYLRREMKAGKPIYDSYTQTSGELIESRVFDPIKGKNVGEFLNAERNLLKSRGWQYNIKIKAWTPPH